MHYYEVLHTEYTIQEVCFIPSVECFEVVLKYCEQYFIPVQLDACTFPATKMYNSASCRLYTHFNGPQNLQMISGVCMQPHLCVLQWRGVNCSQYIVSLIRERDLISINSSVPCTVSVATKGLVFFLVVWNNQYFIL